MKPNAFEIDEALSMVERLMGHGLKDALVYSGEYGELGYWDWYNDNCQYFKTIGLHVYAGASKVVFFKDKWNWVIKLGFMRETNKRFVARGTDFNYCELEADIYRCAEDNHLERYFAATYACGEVNGVRVFMQEKVTIMEDELIDRVYEYGSSHDKCEDDGCFESEDYIAAILGEDFDDYMDLIEFVDEHDINDLHALNWGKAADGRIIMIDFSGYID